MTLFLITLAALGLAMAGMALGVLLGRSAELRRGCTAECPCAVRDKPCARSAGRADARGRST